MEQKPLNPGRPVIVSVPDNPNPGPTSIAGKAISSRNAIRHGCCADSTLILKTENPDDYKQLDALYFKSYSPQSDHEKHLVQELTSQDWLFQRATRAVAEVEADIYQAEPNAAKWTEQQQRTLGRFLPTRQRVPITSSAARKPSKSTAKIGLLKSSQPKN